MWISTIVERFWHCKNSRRTKIAVVLCIAIAAIAARLYYQRQQAGLRRTLEQFANIGDWQSDPAKLHDAVRISEDLVGYCERPHKTVPRLIAFMDDGDSGVRRASIAAIGMVASNSPEGRRIAASAKPQLFGALRDADSKIRSGAMRTILFIGDFSEAEVQTLANALKDPSGGVRYYAAMALGEAGKSGDVALPALEAALKRDDPVVRSAIIEAIGKIGSGRASTLECLALLLHDKNYAIREAACDALGRIGPQAKAAIAALRGAMEHEDRWTRAISAKALWKISGDAKGIVPILIRCLITSEPEDREFTSARVLKAANEALVEIAGTDTAFRNLVCESLKQAQTGAGTAVENDIRTILETIETHQKAASRVTKESTERADNP